MLNSLCLMDSFIFHYKLNLILYVFCSAHRSEGKQEALHQQADADHHQHSLHQAPAPSPAQSTLAPQDDAEQDHLLPPHSDHQGNHVSTNREGHVRRNRWVF